ncbi:MAG: ATPase domain-containing protein [Polyangiales bacterium]
MKAVVEVVDPGVPGLALVLGGGFRLFPRAEGVGPSTSIVVRGAPGTGKTLLGLRLAAALAKHLHGDVVYGCVELLPVELQAQVIGLDRSTDWGEVALAPFDDVPARDDAGVPCVFAATLDLDTGGGELETLGTALSTLLQAAQDAGGAPRALVIDSLSPGYRLGGDTPRVFVDGLCRLAAAKGLVLVLLEEAHDASPTPWTFAADVVLQLDLLRDGPGNGAREMVVLKHRYGPADVGPHHVAIGAQGLRVLPRPEAYLSPWARRTAGFAPGSWTNAPQVWSLLPDWALTDPPDRGVSFSITADTVETLARIIARTGMPREPPTGRCVDVEFALGPSAQTWRSPNVERIALADPSILGHEFVSAILRAVDDALRQGDVQRVILGDMRLLHAFTHRESIRAGLFVVLRVLRSRKIPVVFFALEAMPDDVAALAAVGVNASSERDDVRVQWAITSRVDPSEGSSTPP